MFCCVPYVLSCGTSSEHSILFYSQYCSNFRPTSRFLVIFAFTVRIDAFFFIHSVPFSFRSLRKIIIAALNKSKQTAKIRRAATLNIQMVSRVRRARFSIVCSRSCGERSRKRKEKRIESLQYPCAQRARRIRVEQNNMYFKLKSQQHNATTTAT